MDMELMQAISRVRRSTTNRDVLFVCDECERLLSRSSVVEQGAVNAQVAGSMPTVTVRAKLSRAEIQKNYRVRKKAEASEARKRRMTNQN
jgi:hypothetical protein